VHSIIHNAHAHSGPRSVEVLSILLGFKVACPLDVFFNRGNHEDHALSTVYGFKDEIKKKYPESFKVLWDSINNLFSTLPLGTVLESSRVFTSHAAPPDTSIDIRDSSTTDTFELKSSILNDDVDTRIVDMLWGDPDVDMVGGTRPNEKRGCGIIYGPDEVRKFCQRHNLNTYVRSHECVMNGVEYINCEEDTHMWTVFSASSYPNFEGFNEAAVLTFEHGDHNPKITQFESEELEFPQYDDNEINLHELIFHSKDDLWEDFEKESTTRRRVTVTQWCKIMERYLGPMDWLDLQPQIAPCVFAFRDGKIENTNEIAFDRFLAQYESATVNQDEQHAEISYRTHRHLFRLFNSLDVNHDGEISRSEFKTGIKALNRRLPDDFRICHNDEEGLDNLFNSLDLDSSGDICVHEFSGLIEKMIEDKFITPYE